MQDPTEDPQAGSMGGSQYLKRLKEAPPTDAARELPGGQVTALPPFREFAGVDLCRRLIWAIGIVVVLVLLASALAEWHNSSRAEDAQTRVLDGIAAMRAEPITPSRIAAALEAVERLKALAASKGPRMDAAAVQVDLRLLTKVLSALAAAESDPIERDEWNAQRESLAAVRKNMADLQNVSEARLDALAANLKYKQETLPAESLDQQRLSAVRELQKDVETARESERKHIISMTQLILVNVLLPLLTAMFGYIFGTGQAAQGASSNADKGQKE